jgi:hypothetical protein
MTRLPACAAQIPSHVHGLPRVNSFPCGVARQHSTATADRRKALAMAVTMAIGVGPKELYS